MARTRKSECSTTNCDEEIYCVGMCRKCYQGARYWKGKSMKAIVNRGKQLKVLEGRMDALMPKNVTRLKRRA